MVPLMQLLVTLLHLHANYLLKLPSFVPVVPMELVASSVPIVA
jgi:hypothetical protein